MTDIIDEDKLLEEIREEFDIDFRDPYESPWGDPERQTRSQGIVWDNLKQHGIWRFAVIGAKGAGKSYNGASFSMNWAQEYPNSTGCLVANSMGQVKDSIGDALEDVCDNLNYDIEYFRSKKIFGAEKSRIYVIDLDGKGIEQGATHICYARSLESVDNLEGTEIDYMVIDEVQDAFQTDVAQAITRNRGTEIAKEEARNPLFISGMTESNQHWMYNLLEDKLGFQTEDEFDPEEDSALLLEPTLQENLKNVGQGTMDDYMDLMSDSEAERRIHAVRTMSNKNRALTEYRDHIHREGKMSEILCHYEPERRVIFSIDFNVSPMSCSVWQEKPWNPKWRQPNVLLEWSANNQYIEKVTVIDPETDEVAGEYNSLEEWEPATTEALAQVDEYEVWPDDEEAGGTEGLMRHIKKDYSNHPGEILLLGDARGDQRSAQSMISNWDIVRDYAQKMGATVIPGLLDNSNSMDDVKYDNPPKEDSINLVNRTLLSANKEAQICFLPHSEYESGGTAASAASTKRKPDGKIDETPDKKEDKSVRRTHLFDTVRYVVWWFKDGGSMDAETYSQMVDEMEQDHHHGYTPGPNRHPDDVDVGNSGGGTTFF